MAASLTSHLHLVLVEPRTRPSQLPFEPCTAHLAIARCHAAETRGKKAVQTSLGKSSAETLKGVLTVGVPVERKGATSR